MGSTVVITHHLPHRQSIHPKYEGSDLNPSFASDLGGLMGPSVSLWIHGRTHESFDYVVNGIVSGPKLFVLGDESKLAALFDGDHAEVAGKA